MKLASSKPVRCAIYTRVSTEHGLDQEFNSLDAQYDAASAYIKSQAHAGWTLIRVNMTISLAFLAPNLVKAAVEGRLPSGLGVERLDPDLIPFFGMTDIIDRNVVVLAPEERYGVEAFALPEHIARCTLALPFGNNPVTCTHWKAPPLHGLEHFSEMS